jgi:hypothetical protein
MATDVWSLQRHVSGSTQYSVTTTGYNWGIFKTLATLWIFEKLIQYVCVTINTPNDNAWACHTFVHVMRPSETKTQDTDPTTRRSQHAVSNILGPSTSWVFFRRSAEKGSSHQSVRLSDSRIAVWITLKLIKPKSYPNENHPNSGTRF